MTTKERGWAIVGKHGFYTGWWLMRRDAIAHHIASFEDVGPYINRSYLNEKQKAAWHRRVGAGDRAVKVEITEIG